MGTWAVLGIPQCIFACVVQNCLFDLSLILWHVARTNIYYRGFYCVACCGSMRRPCCCDSLHFGHPSFWTPLILETFISTLVSCLLSKKTDSCSFVAKFCRWDLRSFSAKYFELKSRNRNLFCIECMIFWRTSVWTPLILDTPHIGDTSFANKGLRLFILIFFRDW